MRVELIPIIQQTRCRWQLPPLVTRHSSQFSKQNFPLKGNETGDNLRGRYQTQCEHRQGLSDGSPLFDYQHLEVYLFSDSIAIKQVHADRQA